MSVVAPPFASPVKAAFFDKDVKRDYAHIASYFGIGADKVITAKQEHTNICHIVTQGYQEEIGDALVTNEKEKILSVITADCAPVLFSDGHIIGAAHAGWKGALYGVLENTIAEMQKLGARAENIQAFVGPCIGPQSYEVGEEFRKIFLDMEQGLLNNLSCPPPSGHPYMNSPPLTVGVTNAFFRMLGTKNKYLFDLPAYVIYRLQRAGVRHASWVGKDTYTDETDYYSFRRATQRGEPSTGRQVSSIALF